MKLLDGVVLFYNSKSGTGYIDAGIEEDVFFHFSAIVGHQPLFAGDCVSVKIIGNTKGPTATVVVPKTSQHPLYIGEILRYGPDGYGFIQLDTRVPNIEPEPYFHFSGILKDATGQRFHLWSGDQVVFQIQNEPDGNRSRAIKVHPTSFSVIGKLVYVDMLRGSGMAIIEPSAFRRFRPQESKKVYFNLGLLPNLQGLVKGATLRIDTYGMANVRPYFHALRVEVLNNKSDSN